jgi:hypothetical protein
MSRSLRLEQSVPLPSKVVLVSAEGFLWVRSGSSSFSLTFSWIAAVEPVSESTIGSEASGVRRSGASACRSTSVRGSSGLDTVGRVGSVPAPPTVGGDGSSVASLGTDWLTGGAVSSGAAPVGSVSAGGVFDAICAMGKDAGSGWEPGGGVLTCRGGSAGGGACATGVVSTTGGMYTGTASSEEGPSIVEVVGGTSGRGASTAGVATGGSSGVGAGDTVPGAAVDCGTTEGCSLASAFPAARTKAPKTKTSAISKAGIFRLLSGPNWSVALCAYTGDKSLVVSYLSGEGPAAPKRRHKRTTTSFAPRCEEIYALIKCPRKGGPSRHFHRSYVNFKQI